MSTCTRVLSSGVLLCVHGEQSKDIKVGRIHEGVHEAQASHNYVSHCETEQGKKQEMNKIYVINQWNFFTLTPFSLAPWGPTRTMKTMMRCAT